MSTHKEDRYEWGTPLLIRLSIRKQVLVRYSITYQGEYSQRNTSEYSIRMSLLMKGADRLFYGLEVNSQWGTDLVY